MDIFTTTCVVIVLIILVVCCSLFLPRAHVFYDMYFVNNVIDTTRFNHNTIYKELTDEQKTPPVVPVFAADKDDLGKVYFTNCTNLLESLSSVDNLKYAGIINLKSDFEQKVQRGYAPNANKTLRYFLPLRCPCVNKSGIWVNGEKRFFHEGEWICADMSRDNSLFNKYRYENAIVLFMDIEKRPTPGISQNDKLDDDEILKCFI